MQRIIINADDFGKNASVTKAILECLRKKWITQTTLMVNMPAADDAVEQARMEHFDSGVGIHLNLTEGMPLSMAIRRVREICNDEGEFRPHCFGYASRAITPEIRYAVEEEVRAQIEKYLSYHLPLMHCDGHHHVHCRLGFAKIILPLLKEYGFKSVRNRCSIFIHPWYRGVRGRFANWQYQNYVHRMGLTTTAGFGGWNREDLSQWRKFDSFEIMVHPDFNANGEVVDVTDFDRKTGALMNCLASSLFPDGYDHQGGSCHD